MTVWVPEHLLPVRWIGDAPVGLPFGSYPTAGEIAAAVVRAQDVAASTRSAALAAQSARDWAFLQSHLLWPAAFMVAVAVVFWVVSELLEARRG